MEGSGVGRTTRPYKRTFKHDAAVDGASLCVDAVTLCQAGRNGDDIVNGQSATAPGKTGRCDEQEGHTPGGHGADDSRRAGAPTVCPGMRG